MSKIFIEVIVKNMELLRIRTIMYHKSSLDEYFFDYYKRNKLSEII